MNINTFVVVPSLPERIKHLEDMAYNMWWCWKPEAMGLFQRIDRDLWNQTHHNPVEILGQVSQDRLKELAEDEGFVSHLDRVWEQFQDYMNRKSWFDRNHGDHKDLSVAYFSAEYGISESVPVYSGGLGVLSGDHLKGSSDLGIPLTAVGLLYRQGYFRQYLNADGWQQEHYPENDFYNLPVSLLEDDNGSPLRIQVEYPGHVVHAQIWQLMVGRTRLLLLDTNLPSNTPDDQDITAQLYGGGHDMRVKQEMLMGIGGVRALRAAGVEPSIYHMNEGHSAFLGLERVRILMEENDVDFDTALKAVRASNCFTTHTPVAAGNDAFAPETMSYFFKEYIKSLGISMERFMGLGRQNRDDQHEHFSMTVLALRLAAHNNGVSQLHGEVSRKMWLGVYPGIMEDEVPIGAITNGIHTPTWISHEMSNLYDRYLGPDWAEDPTNPKTWEMADRIPEAELWRTHERRRERLVAFARRRLREQLERRGAPQREIEQAEEVLDPEALTIGFARRFALYKRGTLLLRDRERLRALLTDKERPIQIIFAGKAHPADTMAKEIIRELVHFMRDPEIRRRIVFLEDYDMNVARYLVQGCDVWLNTPRRPLEASGTSGMKAAANGALNLSVLDGWWVEGYNRQVGWSIGYGEEYDDLELQDSIESAALYDMLEKEVVPVFYGRAADGLPRAWISRMKACVRELWALSALPGC
jgi:glycogen phosphorylase